MDYGLSFRFARARNLQQNKGIRVKAIAAKSGISYEILRRVEQGIEMLGIFECVLLAKTLDVSPDWLLYDKGTIGERYSDSMSYPLARLLEQLELDEISIIDATNNAKKIKQRPASSSLNSQVQSTQECFAR